MSATAPGGAAAETGRIESAGAGRFRVIGALTFGTVTALRGEGRRAFATAADAVTVDLGAVDHADSAGLALLMDWLGWAQGAGRALHFTAVPAALQALAKLSDVEPMLSGGVDAAAVRA